LSAAGKAANVPPGEVVDALYGADAQDLTGLFAEARARATAEINARSDAAFQSRSELESAHRETEARRSELDAIRARGENLPDVPGFAEARAEIRAKMLAARPLYELLEPASGCDGRHLALLERLAGDEFLATWVVRPDEADQVRRIAWKSADGGGTPSLPNAVRGRVAVPPATVAVRGGSDDVSVNDLAPWLGTLVSFEESDVEAVALLARHHITSSTHGGVKTMLGLHFVSKGLISKESGRAFSNLFDSRQRGDYDEFVYSTLEEVDELYPKAQRFIAEVDALLEQNPEND
jgi:hypothetical protein